MKSLLVLGGNGFIGRALCKAAVRKGWSVTSLSRHGAPSKAIIEGVNWEQGSALDTDLLRDLISDKDYVVNCIGTLLETSGAGSYEALNYQTMASCIEALRTQTEKRPDRCVGYISAASFDPFTKSLLSKYYETKGRAEKELLGWTAKEGNGHGIIFRPGLVYGWDRPATVLISFFFRILTLFSANLFPPPVNVNRLADCIIRELCNGEVHQQQSKIIEPKDM